MGTAEIPLFPLRSVLFPGGFLPLRIFEQRYLTMIRDCASNDTGFGVCLIREGAEAASPVKITDTGTHAKIVDWYTLEDGLLGVSAIGTSRFLVESTWTQDDGLLRARVRILPEPPRFPLPEAYALLAPLGYLLMTSIEGQIITPWLVGRRLEMNTVAVFLTVVFWGWL